MRKKSSESFETILNEFFLSPSLENKDKGILKNW